MAVQAFPESKDIKLTECSFDAMKLQIGERLELDFIGQVGHKPYFSRLIGYLYDQGLIVQTPLINGLPVTLRNDEPVLVRVFSGTQAFAFTSTVVRICVSPFFYLHLSFPPVVQGAEIRKTLRVKVNLAARLTQGSNVKLSLPIEAVVADLSIAGILLDAHPD